MSGDRFRQLSMTNENSKNVCFPIATLSLEPKQWRARCRVKCELIEDDDFDDFAAALLECYPPFGNPLKLAIVRMLMVFGTTLKIDCTLDDKTFAFSQILSVLELKRSDLLWIQPDVDLTRFSGKFKAESP
jgi:hypothetical protein